MVSRMNPGTATWFYSDRKQNLMNQVALRGAKKGKLRVLIRGLVGINAQNVALGSQDLIFPYTPSISKFTK